MSLISDGIYCPGCGYDLRGLSSDRCPECGLSIDAVHSGIIPWERRRQIGYCRSFFLTLLTATFRPARLARATGGPIDLRSARLFRWSVLLLLIVPSALLFVAAAMRNGDLDAIFSVERPLQIAGSFWEPRYLWAAGATLWPTLPIGFALSLIFATGISHWFFMKRLAPERCNRAMAFSFYLGSPLLCALMPCLTLAGIVMVSTPDWADWTDAIDSSAKIYGFLGIISALILWLAMALTNMARAVDSATRCGIFRSGVVIVAVITQAAASLAFGLALFPAMIGLFRLMIGSLWR